MPTARQNGSDPFGSDNIKNEEVVPSTVDNLRSQRIKRGECPTCQRKTHKVSRFKNKREPLTVEGEVVNGICLRCNPLTKTPTADTVQTKEAPVKVPDTFVCDDELTVASEITLDTCIEQQVSKRSNRYNSKTFESVSEGKAMSDDQVPTDIIGSHRVRRDRGRGQPPMPRLVDDEDDEEEDKKWIATQRRQRFHPMSREMYLFNSERTLGIESTGTGVESTDGSEHSSECFGPPKLHPLSRELHRLTSERSLSVSMNESHSSGRNKMSKQPSDKSLSLEKVTQNESVNTDSDKSDNRRTQVMKREPSATSLSAVSSDSGYSSDGQRMKKLMQGSTSLMKEEGKMEAQVDMRDVLQQSNHRHRKCDSFTPASVKRAESRRPNRFSLRQADQNRFSLNLKDLRASAPTDPSVDFETEMHYSRCWNSVDILRDAAAEVNGEKFNLDDFAKEMEVELMARNSEEKPKDNSSSNVATEKTSISPDKISPTLRSPSSAVNKAKTADHSDISGLSAGDIIDSLRGYSSTESPACRAFFEAACGRLANLALITDNHSQLVELGVVQVLCDALHMHSTSKEVSLVCCRALANLAASSLTRKSIGHGFINDLFACIRAEFDCPEVDQEAFRALCGLSDSSTEAKQIISCDLDTIIATFYLYQADKYIQTATCSILQRLSQDVFCRTMLMACPEIFDVVGSIIQANPNEETIEIQACSLLRNLSVEENGDSTLRSASFVPFVMIAMSAHVSSEELFENACFFLSTVGMKQPKGFGALCTEEGIKRIISALQIDDTSASILEACCLTLYAAVNDSDEHKKLCLSTGAIDAIICLIMVHPHATSLLEAALAVLVSLSSKKKYVAAIANSGGIGSVVVSMRSNPTCSGIIKNGSRFITNVVKTDTAFANEAVPAVVPILACISEGIHDQTLIEELCKSLHYLVITSENWADRIITADGIDVIERAMKDNKSNTSIVDECGALLQILYNVT